MLFRSYGQRGDEPPERGRPGVDPALDQPIQPLQPGPFQQGLIDLEPALIGLSWLLSASADARLRNPGEALQLATEAVSASKRTNPLALDALASALARSGRFDDAVATATEAAALARRARADELRAQIEGRRALYESRRAYEGR